MSNPFFDILGGNSIMGMNPMTMLTQLKGNPMGLLRQVGFNVPDNINNPQAIIQYLMNSGQINQQQLTNAQMMAQNFRIK